jgi:hypothetical protein
MVVAPAAVRLAVEIWMVATPLASVSAVPVAGDMLARPVSVVKLTTRLGTTAPAVSLTVAATLAGLPLLILVKVAPVAGSVSAMAMLAAMVFGGASPGPLTQPVSPSMARQIVSKPNLLKTLFRMMAPIIPLSLRPTGLTMRWAGSQ